MGIEKTIEIKAIDKEKALKRALNILGVELTENEAVEIVEKVFDLRPGAIIRDLDLRRPIYKQTAAYGHFGRNDLNLPWEQLNKVEEIKKYL